jgi:N-acetyl-alpha-D-muramate 1-phosphate uridylyltransferase
MQCVVLAGGLGTRMRPITETLAKVLIPVCGIPFIDYSLRYFASQGIEEVLLLIGFRGDDIRKYVGNGERYGLKIKYVDEGKELRGTAGALRLALEQDVLHEAFFLIYGDSFLPISFRSVWSAFQDANSPALMTILRNNDRWDKSNVIFDSKRIELYQKNASEPDLKRMKYIDYGLSVVRKKTIEEAVPPNQKYDLAEVFNRISLKGQLAGFEVFTRFYEIGSQQGLADFEKYVRENKF